jgi:tetratricopeptide (TPR) repeat protein
MIRNLSALALLLSLAAPAAAQEPEPDFAPAKALLDAGQFDEAAASYRRIAEQYAARYPRSAEQRYYCSGGGAETLLYLTTATADGVSAVALDRDWCEALFMQAYAHVEAKRLDLAVAPLEEALELAPYNAKYANEYGFVLSRLGRLDAGMAAYRQALAAAKLGDGDDRNAAVAWRGIGWIHSDRREWDAAEEALRKSLEIEPDNAIARGELDYVAQQRGSD